MLRAASSHHGKKAGTEKSWEESVVIVMQSINKVVRKHISRMNALPQGGPGTPAQAVVESILSRIAKLVPVSRSLVIVEIIKFANELLNVQVSEPSSSLPC